MLDRAFDFLFHQASLFPRQDCLSARRGKEWTRLSTTDTVERVNRISLGLMGIGIEKGDKVAIAADNCLEWTLVDLALQQIGAVSVPLYPTCTLDDARYILAHAEVKLAFAGSASLARKLTDALCGSECPIYGFVQIDGIAGLDELEAQADQARVDELDTIRAGITADDVFTIIYTSGTTGRSKGVVLNHRNVTSTVRSVAAHTGLPQGSCRALSFLPLSHIFERAGVLYYMYTGTAVYFATVETLSTALAEVRPHTFSAVPRVLEKVYEKLVGKARTLKGVQRRIYLWALRIAENYEPSRSLSPLGALQFALARKLVFSKWHAAMGGELRWINVGSAALQPRLARMFWAAGVVVSEGYGMTEAAPVISANPFSARDVRIGTVGIAMPGVEVRLADDGEILVRGPNVMVGYYKEPELTAEALAGGWLHTGDIGVVEDGYIRITDRKKEMFKTSNGKYIAPQIIENKLKESAFIDQIMVVGDGQKYASALIVPLFEKLREWCSDHGIAYTSDSEMARHPRIVELIDREIKRFNRQFGSWEHIKKFSLVETPWCVDRGELAPTLKLRRKVIAERCRHLIESMYAHPEPA
ncbi:AMP-dependent synthetase/ligase [Paludibacterium paludis]|uniref:AMP-dependent synthetase n=1 Tax=Paludibacterium paludis TaxID=1225769 RepID=A0A918NZI7_9NEIS|nr:long-chain fatty acid--CoA ligase [Paludibacterium paludis]GGY08443.1 AMP-dependent synthetase [Paludibacterium paludis]